jgi:hypothetical protein
MRRRGLSAHSPDYAAYLLPAAGADAPALPPRPAGGGICSLGRFWIGEHDYMMEEIVEP